MYTEHLRTGHCRECRFRLLFANEPMALMMVGETCPLPFIVMLSAGVDESQSIHACTMHISMYTYFITQHFLNMPKELRADADVADPRLMVPHSSNHAPLWSGTQPHLAVHTWEKKVRHPSRAGSSRPMHHVSPAPFDPPFQCCGVIHRYVSERRGATASF